MKYISSRDNPFFKELAKLADSARHRKKNGQALLDGVHLLQSCLASGCKPQHLLVTASALKNYEVTEIVKRLPDIPLTQLDAQLFAALSDLKSLSGILSLIAQPKATMLPAQSNFCLLLEDIQDPGNLGSILRSAAAAGCDSVFLSKGCADAWSSRVLRAGMGGHFVINIEESVDLKFVAKEFQGKILAGCLSAKTSLYDCDLRGKLAIAIGNEGSGLSEELLSAVSQHITIPMPGKIESLNAASAAAVILFEGVRQRTEDRGQNVVRLRRCSVYRYHSK